jgi:hypothetical protein
LKNIRLYIAGVQHRSDSRIQQCIQISLIAKLLSHLALYEQRLTKTFHANMNLLLKLQSLRQPVLAKEKTMTAAA